MIHHSPAREARLNGPILESLTAHHRSRKGWTAGSRTAGIKTVGSWDAFYSVADEYPFPGMLAKETEVHINSVTNSSQVIRITQRSHDSPSQVNRLTFTTLWKMVFVLH